eukprot:TRINITY_DN2486_c0_g3_i1.p1 TRINITY_DN2486_c0_g3~~TRINITY_DN2486_c0_g3_i1.p1  ORF type:complete len:277 (+),score=48.29 TRINITY_DN2486_c0_g3_i1:414-1244(+)
MEEVCSFVSQTNFYKIKSEVQYFRNISRLFSIKPSLLETFANFAIGLSHRSGDMETKVGCVLVNNFGQVLGFGYNGEVKNTDNQRANKEKTNYMVHAEMNAISHANCNLSREKIIIITTRSPCQACMKTLLQYDILAIFYYYEPYDIVGNNKKKKYEESREMVEERGIPMIQLRGFIIYTPDCWADTFEIKHSRERQIDKPCSMESEIKTIYSNSEGSKENLLGVMSTLKVKVEHLIPELQEIFSDEEKKRLSHTGKKGKSKFKREEDTEPVPFNK